MSNKTLFSIMTVLVLAGCGTRKTNKSHEAIKALVTDTAAVNMNTGITDIKAKTLEQYEQSNFVWNSEAATLTPVNPGQPMTVTDGAGKTTTFTNAVVNLGKASGSGTKDKTAVLHESSIHKDTTATVATSGHKESLKKVSDAKSANRTGNPIGISIGVSLGICAVLAFLWFVVFKRNRN